MLTRKILLFILLELKIELKHAVSDIKNLRRNIVFNDLKNKTIHLRKPLYSPSVSRGFVLDQAGIYYPALFLYWESDYNGAHEEKMRM